MLAFVREIVYSGIDEDCGKLMLKAYNENLAHQHNWFEKKAFQFATAFMPKRDQVRAEMTDLMVDNESGR